MGPSPLLAAEARHGTESPSSAASSLSPQTTHSSSSSFRGGWDFQPPCGSSCHSAPLRGDASSAATREDRHAICALLPRPLPPPTLHATRFTVSQVLSCPFLHGPQCHSCDTGELDARPYFLRGETKARRGRATCPKSPTQSTSEQRLKRLLAQGSSVVRMGRQESPPVCEHASGL